MPRWEAGIGDVWLAMECRDGRLALVCVGLGKAC